MAAVLIDRSRRIAIAVRRERAGIAIVEHSPGRLCLRHLSDQEFIEEWREYDYPLERALDRFLAHAREVGATRGALGAIERLRTDPMALAPRLI